MATARRLRERGGHSGAVKSRLGGRSGWKRASGVVVGRAALFEGSRATVRSVFGLSLGEFVVVILVAMVVMGPKELPKLLRKAGEWAGKLRRMAAEMRAGGESMVNASLRRQGVMVNKVKKRRTSGGKAIKQKDIAVFTRQLSTMMRAGVPQRPSGKR